MATLFKRKKKEGGYVYYVTGYVNGKHFMRSTKTSDKKIAKEVLRKIEEDNIRIEEGLESIDKLEPILLSKFIKASSCISLSLFESLILPPIYCRNSPNFELIPSLIYLSLFYL